MGKNIKIIVKQAFLLIIVVLISFKLISRAETLSAIPKCNGQKCLSNISDVMIANSGDFFLLVDSGTTPYVRKIIFSSNMIDDDIVIPINENNSDGTAFKINISNDSKKALVYRETSSSEQTSSSSGSLIHIVDLERNLVNPITPYTESGNNSKTVSNEGISVASFLNKEGTEIIASTNNSDKPKLYLINSNTGQITNSIDLDDTLGSIEVLPDFKKAVVTFKTIFIEAAGIYDVNQKTITKLEVPQDIYFKVGAFLQNVSVNLTGKKTVISSLGGQHVLYFLNLDKNELIIRFLSDNHEGKTCSAISPDGNTVISASELSGTNQIVIYKVNGSNLKKLNIIKTAKIKSDSSLLDVKITPDGNNIFLLLLNDGGLKLKVVSVKDLSELCEYEVSDTFNDSFLTVNPYGQFLLIPELQGENLNLITDLNLGPVFRSINPSKASRKEGTQFTIDGFVDSSRFLDEFKVCFRSEKFCAMSVSISDDGKKISGITPIVPFKGKSALFLIGKSKKEESDVSSSSGGIKCKQSNYTRSKYKGAFLFE